MEDEQGEAGSFFGSESEAAQSQHVVEQGAVAADSVNYGAQSPVSADHGALQPAAAPGGPPPSSC